MEHHGGFVLELDIEGYFDAIDHSVLRSFLDKRIRDGVLRRTIDKWLRAGVLEEGCIRRPASGSPQGGVISPILANIFLHEVFDRWFEQDVQPRLRGASLMVRYADDAVVVFSREDDARRVIEVIGKRFARFGLRLHPSKTRLIRFQRPAYADRGKRHDPKGASRTFDFLGFTHYWAVSRNGNHVVKRKTARQRLSRSLHRISAWLREHRHDSLQDQHQELSRKVRGHYGYFGIRGNSRALSSFCWAVWNIWRKWLGRRSHKGKMPWHRFEHLRKRYPLPVPRLLHPVT